MSPTLNNTNAQTMASLASTLQACQQALQSLQMQQQPASGDNTQANTIATGVNDSPSTNQAPIGDVNSPAVNVSDVPITTVPIATNVATNMPITNLPFIGSPITTTPIADNAVNTAAGWSNDAVVGTTAVGNVANVVAISDCPVTVVSFADSPTTTNVADAQVAAFLTALTTLVQQNFVNVSSNDSSFSDSTPAPAPVSPAPASPPSTTQQADSKPAQVLQQLQALGFNNTARNLALLKHFKGDYFQTLNQLLAERRAGQQQWIL